MPAPRAMRTWGVAALLVICLGGPVLAAKIADGGEEKVNPDMTAYGPQVGAMVCGEGAPLAEFCTTFRTRVLDLFTAIDALGAKYMIKVPAAEAFAADLGETTGFAPDVIKYLLCLVMAYPLGFIISLLPGAFTKHVFNVVSGVFAAQYVLGGSWIHPFITATVCYVFLTISQFIPAFNGSRHYIVFIICMTYMTASHLYRIFIDYMGWTLDFTGPQMLLTIKLSALGYNLHDGTTDLKKNKLAAQFDKKKEEEDRNKARAADKKAGKDEAIIAAADKAHAKKLRLAARAQRQAAERLQYCIEALPNPVEYYSWIFCVVTFFAGPAFEIREFLDGINGSAYDKKGVMPGGRIVKAITCFVMALVILGIHVVGDANLPVKNLLNHEVVSARSPVVHMAICWITLAFVRFKYYFGWIIAEGAAVIAGLGYNKKTKSWTGANNIDLLGFEFAGNVQNGTKAWNKFTQVWLQRHVYFRTGNNLAAVYFMSAFWHGFYPGYYVFFMSVPLATWVHRELRARVSPRFGDNIAFKVVAWFITSLAMNYLAAAFQVLDLDYSLYVWRSFYFSGHIIMIVMYVLLLGVRAPSKKAKKA